MAYAQELSGYFAEYEAAVQEVQQKRKMFDGVLGLGNHPGNAACHEMLDRQVSGLCQRAAAEGADPEEIEALFRGIVEAEKKWKGPEYARLMLVALQRHTIPLAAALGEERRQELARWYEKEYPHRRSRLPVQDEVLAALMGLPEKKKGRQAPQERPGR